jgi:hypothetical protein
MGPLQSSSNIWLQLQTPPYIPCLFFPLAAKYAMPPRFGFITRRQQRIKQMGLMVIQ